MNSEPLDIEHPDQLQAYLHRTGRLAANERPTITVLAGGVSNRTVLVERETGPAWVLKQALAKLRVEVDWFSDVARIAREAMGIRHLATLAPPGTITPLVFEDEANHLLAMEAVPQPHENLKTKLMSGRIEPSEMQQFGQILGVIHRRACEQRIKMQSAFEDGRFFESLRLEPYYAYSATQMPEAREPLLELIEHTRRRRITITHGDYSPKNILVYEGKLVLLDHEVIHWGDPAFDLGFGLAHLVSKAHHLRKHRDAMVDAAATFWSAYKQEIVSLPWARDVEVFAVWHLLACLLARAVGRSKLEYLTPAERQRQAAAAAALLRDRPAKVLDAANAFLQKV